MSVTHDSDPKLACTLFANDGTELRFGPDEADAEDVVTDVSFGTEVPGWGFAEGSVKVSRPTALSSLDANLFAAAHVYDEAGQTVYRGRVAKINRSGSEIELDLEGPLAHLDDDPTVRVIYRDTDLGNWQGMSRARKLAAYAASRTPGDGDATYDTSDGYPSMELATEGSWAAAAQPDVEAWYDAGSGGKVAKIAGTWTRLATATNTNWYWSLAVADDDDGTGYTSTGDLQSEPTASAQASFTPGTPRRFALLDFIYTGGPATGLDSIRFAVSWTNLAVYGNHGLTIRGSEPTAGFYASDVVTHALGYAPLIDVALGGIEQSSFVIPHLVFRDFGTTARQIIEAVSLYGASGFQPPDWGYYEDGFFWMTPGTYGRTWRLRRDQGSVAIDEGPSTESRCNGFIVSYTDAAGTSRTVGPPGSGADYETDQLADNDPANPVNINGIPRRYGSRDVGITSQDGAVLLGQLLLRDANTRRYSGSAEVKGRAMDEAGNLSPAYLIRAGDYAVFEDDEDTTPKKIVSTNYANGTTALTLDNKSASIETALARLDVAIKPAGF